MTILSSEINILHDLTDLKLKLQKPVDSSQASLFQPMVLSIGYAEQMGNALQNLFDLQCWAKSVNITKVVEPCIHGNSKGVFYFSDQETSCSKFRDLFNISRWNQISLILNRSVLVSRNDFFRYASRDVIYVQIIYNKNYMCKSLIKLADKNWFQVLKYNGFDISTVCLERPRNGLLTDDAFQREIFKSTHASKHNVTIIFEHWRGLGNSSIRLKLAGTRCTRLLLSPYWVYTRPQSMKYFPNSLYSSLPAQQVLDYLDKFLSEYMHGMEYVAVMLRSEKIIQSVSLSSLKFSKCTESIMSDYMSALDRINGTKTLLFTDDGPYGSQSLSGKIIANNLSYYLQDNLKPELSPRELDSALVNMIKSNGSVIIALLQSLIVSRATCTIMIGGGTFQYMTMSMYAQNHRGHECYYFRTSNCRLSYIPTVY